MTKRNILESNQAPHKLETANTQREDDLDPLEDKLVDAHGDEIECLGAKASNFGWVSSGTDITSKTSVGILYSEIDQRRAKLPTSFSQGGRPQFF